MDRVARAAARTDHVRKIREGAKAFGVILTAVDPEVSPRTIKSFDADQIMVGGTVIEDDDGVLWLVDAGRRPAPILKLKLSTAPDCLRSFLLRCRRVDLQFSLHRVTKLGQVAIAHHLPGIVPLGVDLL